MSGTFGGYYVARTGMYTSQAALNVTSSNLSSADVEDYTRQQVIQEEIGTNSYGSYSTGSGTDVETVRQIRSSYLDASYRKQNSELGYWETYNEQISTIETSLYYGEDSGLDALTSDFFNAWEEASTSPDSAAVRSSVIEEAELLVDTLEQIAEDIDTLRTEMDSTINTTVERMNTLAENIASMNTSLKVATASGDNTSQLLDELNAALDELSSYGDISTIAKDDGSYEVYLAGQTLVNESGAKAFTLTEAADGSYTLNWDSSGTAIDLDSGELKALMDLTAPYSGDVPAFDTEASGILDAYEQTLNFYVSTIANEVNSLHESGTDLNETTGNAFFTALDSSEPIGIGNIQVNPLLDDANYLACSESGESGDGSIALAIANLGDTDLFTDGDANYTFAEYCSETTEWIASEASFASNELEAQEAILDQLTSERSSMNAVSTDEETTNMILYQQIYNANATVMDTLDSILEYLLNQL